MEELYILLKAIEEFLSEDLPLKLQEQFTEVAAILEESISTPQSIISPFIIYRKIESPLSNLNLYQDSEDNTALHYAISHGKIVIAKLLIHYKADINAQNNKKETPLHRAAYNGHIEAIELLTSLKADFQIPAQFHMLAFHYAVQGGHVGPAKKLVFQNVITSSIKEEITSLHIATFNGCIDMAEWLISEGAKIEARTIKGETPLYLAAQNGHYDMCDWLISKGADINSHNNYGETLLYLAVQEGNLELVRFFISKGANPNLPTQNGSTSLHLAVQHSHNNIVEFLLSAEADVNAKTKEGKTPLHYAAIIGNYPSACLLIKAGADVNAKTKDEEAPLHFAIKRGLPDDCKKQHLQIVSELINNRADIDSRSKKDLTPLLIAIKRGNIRMAKTLIDKGADIYAQTICEEDAWELAGHNPELTKLLDDTENAYQKNVSAQEEKSPFIPLPSIKDIKHLCTVNEILATLQSSQIPRTLGASPSKKQRY